MDGVETSAGSRVAVPGGLPDRYRPADAFRRDVVEGLSRRPRSIPSIWFYDAAGSRIFQRIMALPGYYPTRAETTILERHAASAVAALPGGPSAVVDLGAGDGAKTRLLVSAARQRNRGVAYVPVDVSVAALGSASTRMKVTWPEIRGAPGPRRLRGRARRRRPPRAAGARSSPCCSGATSETWSGRGARPVAFPAWFAPAGGSPPRRLRPSQGSGRAPRGVRRPGGRDRGVQPEPPHPHQPGTGGRLRRRCLRAQGHLRSGAAGDGELARRQGAAAGARGRGGLRLPAGRRDPHGDLLEVHGPPDLGLARGAGFEEVGRFHDDRHWFADALWRAGAEPA